MTLAVKVNPYILILRCFFFASLIQFHQLKWWGGWEADGCQISSLQKTKPCLKAYTPPHLDGLLDAY